MLTAAVGNTPLHSAFCKAAMATCIHEGPPSRQAAFTYEAAARLLEHHGEPHFPTSPSAANFFAQLVLRLAGHKLGRPIRLSYDHTWPARFLTDILQEMFEEYCHDHFDVLFMRFMVSSAEDCKLLRFLLMQRGLKMAPGKQQQRLHAFADVVGCDILHSFLEHVLTKARTPVANKTPAAAAASKLNASAALSSSFGGFSAVLPPKTPPEVVQLAELALPFMVRASSRFSKRHHPGVLFHQAVAAAKAWNGEFPPLPLPQPLLLSAVAGQQGTAVPRPSTDAATCLNMMHPLDVRNGSTSLSVFASTLHKLLTTEPARPVAAKPSTTGCSAVAKRPVPKPRPKMTNRKRRASSSSSDSSESETSSSEEDDSSASSNSDSDSDSSSSSASSADARQRHQRQLQARRAAAKRKAARTEDTSKKPAGKVSPTLLEIVGPKVGRQIK